MKTFRLVVLIATMLVPPLSLRATYVSPTPFPADRLIRNAELQIEKHPDDPEAHYLLARLLYRVFANRVLWLEAFDNHSGVPEAAPDWMMREMTQDRIVRKIAEDQARREFGLIDLRERILDPEQRNEFNKRLFVLSAGLKNLGIGGETLTVPVTLSFASRAIRSFRRAIQLDPGNPYYHLGFASITEQLRDYGANDEVPPNIGTLLREGIGLELVLDAYARVWMLSYPVESKREFQPDVQTSPAIESGVAFLRIVESSATNLPEKYKTRTEEIRMGLAQLAEKPQGAITPLIFPISAGAKLDDLTNHSLRLEFDVNGDGTPETVPWINPNCGFLIWDGNKTGTVSDGRQWFGSFSFGMYWDNGFDVLNALDDDGNGWLENNELEGLLFWVDENEDASSDPGELRTLSSLSVRRIATTATEFDGIHPVNREGIELLSGEFLPLWDWMFHLR